MGWNKGVQATLGMMDGSPLCLGVSFHYWMYTGICTVDCMTASLQHSCWGTKICLESHRVSMTTAYNWLPWEYSLLLAGQWPRLIREGCLLPACMPEALGGTVRDTTKTRRKETEMRPTWSKKWRLNSRSWAWSAKAMRMGRPSVIHTRPVS